MKYLIILLLASGCATMKRTAKCPTTKIINYTSTWTYRDKTALASTKKGCEKSYKKSPCPKKFTKKEDGLYNVICGAKK